MLFSGHSIFKLRLYLPKTGVFKLYCASESFEGLVKLLCPTSRLVVSVVRGIVWELFSIESQTVLKLHLGTTSPWQIPIYMHDYHLINSGSIFHMQRYVHALTLFILYHLLHIHPLKLFQGHRKHTLPSSSMFYFYLINHTQVTCLTSIEESKLLCM